MPVYKPHDFAIATYTLAFCVTAPMCVVRTFVYIIIYSAR